MVEVKVAKNRVQEAVKKCWDSQPRLKVSLILRAFWDAACNSPRFFHSFQPANSLQAKCFVSWVMTGSELVAVPIFRSCTTFATGC